jgi:hypothetical protein
MHLLSRRDIQAILSDAGIADYRILSNRICGFAVDFVILF